MHRIDLARATGKPLDLDPGLDGRIIADLVAEWAGTHGEPCTLSLGGRAGGQYRSGSGGEHVEEDAINFCRILAGRSRFTDVSLRGPGADSAEWPLHRRVRRAP